LSLNTWLEIKVVIILCWLGKIVALFLLVRHATWPKDTFTSLALDTFCRFHCIWVEFWLLWASEQLDCVN